MSFAEEKPIVYAKMQKFDDMLAEGKSIAIIQYQYKYNCNMWCSHCSIAGFRKQKGGRQLTVADTKRIFDQAHEYGLASVALTGGEPLVFPDLVEIIEAIGAERFHIQVDTNGWLMTAERARWLKSLGVDKIQISLDGVDAKTHDSFRRMPGSHERAIAAIDNVRNAGMQVQVATVVDHERAQSDELEAFFELIASKNAPISVVYAKPVGEWNGRYDLLCNADDIAHVKALLAKYHGYDHTTPQYGRDLGCIAVKRMVAITAYGDVLPCPWMYWTLGNVHDMPLAELLDKGMRYYGERSPVCRLSEDRDFNEKYTSKLKGRDDLPVPIEEIHGDLLH